MTVRRRTISLALVTTGAALALAACGGGSDNAAASPSSGGASPGTATATATPGPGGSGGPKAGGASGSASATNASGTAGTKTGGKDATSDSYAYKHLCTAGQLSISTKELDSNPDQYVIAVTNRGKAACGLSSYYPRVDLGSKNGADRSHNIHPLVPSGLGGAPAMPVYAGRTVYAVLDVDPNGAKGSNGGIDEINVLADQRFPNAETHNFPMNEGATVVQHPKLGLYRDSVGDAVSSMRTADINGS
ncbi:hypothetical protein [Streptomyces sp. WM6378]|uniref:hypothetical protein n=1 Tax=Streptomyces sp. WM6378 TaxID=1415557 RepID=UPI0006AE87F3|nr:hypothetical protein [Streptomyces sp. WM6378]KOU39425.1 hypothetical protein ADK54_25490 [Streptomyces sp. WM6378]